MDPSPFSLCGSEGPGEPAVWSHGYTEASGVNNKSVHTLSLYLSLSLFLAQKLTVNMTLSISLSIHHSSVGLSLDSLSFRNSSSVCVGVCVIPNMFVFLRLCVAALALDSFRGSREALYGVFDGDRNVEVPYLLQCTMGDVLAEELHKSKNQEDYMTNTFLTMQRYTHGLSPRCTHSFFLKHMCTHKNSCSSHVVVVITGSWARQDRGWEGPRPSATSVMASLPQATVAVGAVSR